MCFVVADVGAAVDVVSLSASVTVGAVVVTLGVEAVAVIMLGVLVLLSGALDVTECWVPVMCDHVVVCFTGLMLV